MKRSIIYSGSLLAALVFAVILLNGRLAQGVLNPGDVRLSTAPTPTQLGQSRDFTARLDFPSLEEASLFRVQFVIEQTAPSQTTTVDVNLPIDPAASTQMTTYVLTTPHGNQTVTVSSVFNDVEAFDPGNSMLPGATFPDTLPGAALPGAGYFKGVQTGAHISYQISWASPDHSFYAGSYSAKIYAHAANPAGTPVPPSNASSQASFAIQDAPTATPTPMPRPKPTPTPTPEPTPIPIPTVVPAEEVKRVSAEGGVVVLVQPTESAAASLPEAGITLTVPALAYLRTVQVRLRTVDPGTLPLSTDEKVLRAFRIDVFDENADPLDGGRLRMQATLKLTLSDAEVAELGGLATVFADYVAGRIALRRLSDGNAYWVDLQTTFDSRTRTFTARLSRLSTSELVRFRASAPEEPYPVGPARDVGTPSTGNATIPPWAVAALAILGAALLLTGAWRLSVAKRGSEPT